MQALKFNLSGKTAFFKQPDVNVNTYFTYNNIHKIALLGMLGAIEGLKGHIQQNREMNENVVHEDLTYPEFYGKLKDLKVSIVPKGDRGYFAKKIQTFNNGVGYASQEEGGNLIVREQWLENPKWDIYILDDNSIDRNIFEKLKDYIMNDKCVYIPYLGKNDHPAVIDECEIVEANRIDDADHIDSLFINDDAEVGEDTINDEDTAFFFKEFEPMTLNKDYNFYEFKEMCFTNIEIDNIINNNNFYKTGSLILEFY